MKVLIIEDDKNDLILVSRYLSKVVYNGESFEISHALTVASALEKIRDHQYKIIFTDLGLPDAVSMEHVRLIKNIVGQTPLIVLSGNGIYGVDKQVLAEGADFFLLKDELNTEALEKAVRSTLENVKQTQ